MKEKGGRTNLLAEVDEFADGFEWELISALICCPFFIVTLRLQCCRGLWDEVIPPPIMFEIRVACDTFWSAKNWMRNLSASKICTSSKSSTVNVARPKWKRSSSRSCWFNARFCVIECQ